MKGILTGKEDIKLSLFTDDMLVYVEDPEELTKNLLKLVSNDTKTAGTRLIYKIELLSYIPTMTR